MYPCITAAEKEWWR